jgi:hypothetical protein
LVKVSVWPSPSKVPWNELASFVPAIVETLMSLVSFTNLPLKVLPPLTTTAKLFQSSVLPMR